MALFVAMASFAAELNIYASGLRNTAPDGSGNVQISYYLNAPATALEFHLINSVGTVVNTVAITDAANLTKGQHNNVVIALGGTADGTYTWELQATAADNAALTQVIDGSAAQYKFYSPRGMAVNFYPETDNFGYMYVSNAVASSSYNNQTKGIFVYDNTLTLQNGATGYVDARWNTGNSTSANNFQATPYRVAVGEDGDLYVACTFAAGEGVWKMDCKNVTPSFSQVYATNLYGIGVKGAGDAREIYGINDGLNLVKVAADGTATTQYTASAIGMTQKASSVAPDPFGGWWICQYRYTDTQANAILTHMSADGVKDFTSAGNTGAVTLLNVVRGTMGVNKDASLIATYTGSKIQLFSVEYDGDHVPSLTYIGATAAIGTNIDGIAFDYADNLYFTSSSSEKLYVYATAKTNVCVTPAASTRTIYFGSAVSVTGVALNQTSATLEKGQVTNLVATVVPNEASDKTVAWTTSDANVATVANGVVTAVGVGNATITATTTDGGFTATCDVTVWANAVTGITLNKMEMALAPTYKETLTATVAPADATDPSFVWASDNEAVATVANGVVTARTAGTANITATTNDGSFVATCVVTVAQPVAHISAYGLNVTGADGEYTFTFSSNTATTNAALEFYNVSTGVKVGEIAIANVVAGENNIDVTAAELPGAAGQEMTWGVRLTGAANPVFGCVYADATSRFGRAHAVVDASPESDYFGRIYVTDRRATAANSGLYVYNPDYSYVNTEAYKLGRSTGKYSRPAVDAEGTLYLADYGDNPESGLYVVDPSDLTTCTQFYQGTRASSGLISNNGVEVGGSLSAAVICGTGANTWLYTSEEDMTPGNIIVGRKIGQEDGSILHTWDGAPTVSYASVVNKNINLGGNNQIVPTSKGLWVCQGRNSDNGATTRCLFFIDNEGALTYTSLGDATFTGSFGGGVAVNAANDRLWVIDAQGKATLKEYAISWNGTTPSITLEHTYNWGYDAASTLHFDYAGNLVACVGTGYGNTDASVMRIAVYSIPTDNNTTTVPAKKALTVKKVSYTRDVTNGNYGTICLPNDVEAANRGGATFYSIAGKNVNGSGDVTSIVLVEEEGMLEAGKPYIFQASADVLYAIYSANVAVADSYNGLVGSFAGTAVAEGMYILSNNQVKKCGTGCSIGANRAYINMENVPAYVPAAGRRVVEISLEGNTATSMDELNGENDAVKFIENGQVYIRRNGVTYDAMGRVVR